MASVTSSPFGVTAGGEEVKEFVLRSASGATASVITYGATLRCWSVPDKDGALRDIVLGFDTLKQYETLGGSLGKTVGRVCNRIRHGKFVLDGRDVQLPINKPPHHCHGGKANFATKVWSASVVDEGRGLKLSCSSADGEEGYPGAMETSVTYTLRDDGSLHLSYEATVQGSATPVNLTNHAYFNLRGHADGSLKGQTITVYADNYLPADKDCLVTGEILPVANTPWDLRSGRDLAEGVAAAGGYDNNFCVRGWDGKAERPAARVQCPDSGLVMETHTDQPGIQLYTANGLQFDGCKGGASYGVHGSFCLETQGWPDAVNHADFPSVIVQPGQTYKHNTLYKISKL